MVPYHHDAWASLSGASARSLLARALRCPRPVRAGLPPVAQGGCVFQHPAGIDPVPLKTCNWNCVYCQLGRTTPLTNERKIYVPTAELLLEVAKALKAHEPGGIDWVTFVGSGETTLHSELGRMIRAVKSMTPLPIAVITNGSLLELAKT